VLLFRCNENDNDVYHGEFCEKSDEILALESRYIIAITVGCAVFLILVLVCACCIRNRKKRYVLVLLFYVRHLNILYITLH